MPNKPSAAKRMRSDAKKQLLNQSTVSELKTLFAKLTQAVQQNRAQAEELARTLISKFDRAITRGIIPHGRADRKKARIGRLLGKKTS